jgi:hypothetical protein
VAAVGWHALLAPLPGDVQARRRPVAPATGLDPAAAAAIAGWSSLVLDLSAADGLRVVQVLLDAQGRPLSASDHVMFRSPGRDGSERPWVRQESIGGRFEGDGTFRGTWWQVEGPEPEDDQPPRWTPVPRAPTSEEVAGLVALVEEVRRRGAAPEPGP